MIPNRIVARLSPEVPAGIATIVVQGPDASDLLLQLATAKTTSLVPGRVHYATWAIPEVGEEQVVLCRKSEDIVELHCHGGVAICNAILDQIEAHGYTRISATDWPANLPNAIDQDAERALIEAPTDKVARLLLAQRNGLLSQEIRGICQLLERTAEPPPEVLPPHRVENTDEAKARLQKLIDWLPFGSYLTQPPRVVLAGPPNAGKSSLINQLVGRERAIVHSEAGTTRDWLVAEAVLNGWPMLLTDTAGIRKTQDEIESEGVERTLQQVANADLILLVVDGTAGWQDTHVQTLTHNTSAEVMVVWNKSDLAESVPMEATNHRHLNSICTSAVTKSGIEELCKAIEQALFAPLNSIDHSSIPPLPFRPRYAEKLEKAKSCLEDPEQAHRAREILLEWVRHG